MKRSTSQASGHQLENERREGGEKLFLSIFNLHPGHLCLSPFKQGRSPPGNSLWCLVVRVLQRGKKLLFKKKPGAPRAISTGAWSCTSCREGSSLRSSTRYLPQTSSSYPEMAFPAPGLGVQVKIQALCFQPLKFLNMQDSANKNSNANTSKAPTPTPKLTTTSAKS